MKRVFGKIIALILCVCLVGSMATYADGSDRSLAASKGIASVESSIRLEGGASTGADSEGDLQDSLSKSLEDGFVASDESQMDSDTESGDSAESSVLPVELTVAQSGAAAVKLTWKSESKEDSYKICRADTKNGDYTQIGTVEEKSGTVTFEDATVSVGNTYYYVVLKYQNGKKVAESEAVYCGVTLLAPVISGVTASGSNGAKITWGKSEYASGYYVYRSTNKTSGYTKIASVKSTVTNYTDTTLINGYAYYYKIIAKAQSDVYNSEYSAYSAYYMKPSAPVVKGEAQKNQIRLSWARPTGADTFYIYRANSSGTYVKIATTTSLSYYDSDVKAGNSYKYKVQAAYTKDGKTLVSDYSSICEVYASGIDPSKPMIALTFDDGPGPYTQEIIDCLKKYNARATFFVVGNRVNSYKSELKAAYAIGCEIGNHTYTHATLTKLSKSGVQSQINKTDSAVKNIIGVMPTIYRAPGGATNSSVRSYISKPHIYWSIDTLDWKTKSKQKTIDSVLKNVKDGDIILMHDIHKTSMQAALYLIPELQKRGYQLVTVSELAEYKGYKMKNGTTYYSFR